MNPWLLAWLIGLIPCWALFSALFVLWQQGSGELDASEDFVLCVFAMLLAAVFWPIMLLFTLDLAFVHVLARKQTKRK